MPPEDGGVDLRAVGEELLLREWDARLVSCRTCGELDVRLQVGRAGRDLVELLGPLVDASCGNRWQAVRVTPVSRVVWCGPARSCSLAELVRFVEDLLAGDAGELTDRYSSLG